MAVSQLLIKIYQLVADESDVMTFHNFVKSQNLVEQLTIIINLIQQNKIKKDYRQLEKQLQKYESEVRTHIRESYIMNQKYDDMLAKIKELEENREQLLEATKFQLNKLKKENEELYQKVKQLQECQRHVEQVTYQSTKISNSKSADKPKKLKEKRSFTNVSPKHKNNTSFEYFVNKRFSQDIVQRRKSVSKSIIGKRKSCNVDLTKST